MNTAFYGADYEAYKLRMLFNDETSLSTNMDAVMQYMSEVYNVTFATFEHEAKELNLSLFEFSRTIAQSDDAATFCSPEHNILHITYNNDVTKERTNWSIAHEIGHIVCNHLTSRNDLAYSVKEAEANMFARELLAPAPLVLYYIVAHRSDNTIPPQDCYFAYRYVFGLSKQASLNSTNFLRSHYRQIEIDSEFVGSYQNAFDNTLHFIRTTNDYENFIRVIAKEFDAVKRYYDSPIAI